MVLGDTQCGLPAGSVQGSDGEMARNGGGNKTDLCAYMLGEDAGLCLNTMRPLKGFQKGVTVHVCDL